LESEPPFQTILFPALVPVSVTVVFVHVIFPEEAAVTVGGTVFEVTVIVAVFVHPVVVLVAVAV